MRPLNMETVLAKVQAKTGALPVFAVTSALILNEGTARVVGKFSKAPKDATEARVAIAAAFGNRVSAVPESFTKIGGSRFTSAIEVSGFIQVNPEVRAIDKTEISGKTGVGAGGAETARYREMAGNVLMDNEDNSLWNLTVAESGSHSISRVVNADLASLVSLASTEDRQAPHIEQVVPMLDMLPDPRNAVYASYFSNDQNAVSYGYVATADVMFSTDTMQTETVGRGQLISFVQLAGADFLANIKVPHEDDSGDVVEYYSALAQANPEFYMNLDNQLSSETVA